MWTRLALAVVVTAVAAVQTVAQTATPTATGVTRPVVAESVAPLEAIAPVARDGHVGTAFLRKPPGNGPFPAVVVIHPGLTAFPVATLRTIALDTAQTNRFLAAGYVVATTTYRSRDVDPQTTVSLQDSLAVVEHVRRLPYVDPRSIALFGCSGGGDLALEVAAATDVAAIAPEEPASVLLTGIFNRDFPKQGERHTPADADIILKDPRGYYTPQYQRTTRDKLARIKAPILILQGDRHAINHFNAQVLIPELRALGTSLEVKTYAGEPHCFAFTGVPPRSPRPAVARQAFDDAHAFFQRHLPRTPRPIDAGLVTHVAIDARP